MIFRRAIKGSRLPWRTTSPRASSSPRLPGWRRSPGKCSTPLLSTSANGWTLAGWRPFAHDPSFFQRSDTQSFLRHLYWRDKLGLGDTKLDPVSRESLDQISEIASKGDLQASDYAELQRQFDKILEIYYPET